MQNEKKSAFIVKWWLWNSLKKTFERHELTVQKVNIAKCDKYNFFRAQNPIAPDHRTPGQDWIIAEGGTGYVLAYGPDEHSVLVAARNRFQLEKEGIREVDVTQYIVSHLDLLKRHVGNTPGFSLPKPGSTVKPVHEPDQFLFSQLI